MSTLALLVLGVLPYPGAASSGATSARARRTRATRLRPPRTSIPSRSRWPTPARSSTAPSPLTAAATSQRGIDHVTFQRSSAGGWTDVCSDATAPFSCDLHTTAVADGPLEIRAVAADNAGYSRTDTRTLTVDNTAPTTSLSAGATLAGGAPLTGAASDDGSGLAATAIQYRPAGGSTWTNVCAAASCTWDTTALTDGGYDLRITATDGAGNPSASSPVTNVAIDNHAPTVSLTDPGPAGAAVTLSATTGDGTGTGVTSIVYRYRLSSGGAWANACTGASTPFSCTWNTSGVPEGSYDVQAIAADGAGFSTSTMVTGVTVDHTPPAAPAPT